METVAGPQESEAAWLERQRYWRRRLGRLRLDAEPIPDQVEKYRKVTWVLTAIPAALSLFFIALFTAFRRPDVGAILAAVLMAPIVTIAWLDFAWLKRKADAYLRELSAFEARQQKRATEESASTPPVP